MSSRRPPVVQSAVAALLVGSPSWPAPAQADTPSPAVRQVVSRADPLPRRAHVLPALPALPSELLLAPGETLQPLGARLDAQLAAHLAAHDIQDNANLHDQYPARDTLAQLRVDWTAVPGWTPKARALQNEPAGWPAGC